MRGELVASHDAKNRPLIAKRIMKLVNEVGDLCPVNRLELNTEGLLLLTNNRILVSFLTELQPLSSHDVLVLAGAAYGASRQLLCAEIQVPG